MRRCIDVSKHCSIGLFFSITGLLLYLACSQAAGHDRLDAVYLIFRRSEAAFCIALHRTALLPSWKAARAISDISSPSWNWRFGLAFLASRLAVREPFWPTGGRLGVLFFFSSEGMITPQFLHNRRMERREAPSVLNGAI